MRPDGAEVVSWPVVVRALDEFVAAVASWTPSDCQLAAEEDPDAPRLEYYTGLSTHEIQGFGFLPEAASHPAIDPLAQVVRDLTHRTSTGPVRDGIVSSVRIAARPAGHGWWDLRQQLLPAPGKSFASDGYDGARAVRKILGLDGQPIDNFEPLLGTVDVEVSAESPAVGRRSHARRRHRVWARSHNGSRERADGDTMGQTL